MKKPVTPKLVLVSPLPEGLTVEDLKPPKDYKDHIYEGDFELWYTDRFGWCIPTLQIAGARRDFQRRTYAVMVKGENLVRLGNGPHVKQTLRFIATKANKDRLEKFWAIRLKGQEMAGDTRDRISTRRAQTAMRRRGDGLDGLRGLLRF